MKDYLTWWEWLPYSSNNASWYWLPDDPLFHAWFSSTYGSMPDPRRGTEESATYFAGLCVAAKLWKYMRMRQLEGKPLFTEASE